MAYFRRIRVKRGAPRTVESAALRAFGRDAATVSRCSLHAADSRNPNKEGKQEAKKDDDEHEIEQHGFPAVR
jgi:hypothetical protein